MVTKMAKAELSKNCIAIFFSKEGECEDSDPKVSSSSQESNGPVTLVIMFVSVLLSFFICMCTCLYPHSFVGGCDV